jgi:UDP-glucose 4-epimerase
LKVLITGSCGFLGTHLILSLLKQPTIFVTGIDFQPPKQEMLEQLREEEKKRFLFIQADLMNESLLQEFVQGQQVIYHLAAQTSHTLAMQEPVKDLENNVAITLRLLEVIRKNNPQARVIYPSTSTVIGLLKNQFADEAHPENPVGLYSAHKLVCEKYFSIYHRNYGLKTTVLRFANLFGPWGNPSPQYNFINFFIHRAWNREDLPVFDSGEQLRNVLYVKDAVQVLEIVASQDSLIGRMLFAASPYHHSVREIAEAVAAVFDGVKIQQEPTPAERRQIEVHDAVISSDQFNRLTGWTPDYDLLTGLRETRKALEKNSFETPAYEKSRDHRSPWIPRVETY